MKHLAKRMLAFALEPSGLIYRLFPPRFLAFLDMLSTPPAGDEYYGERASEYEFVRLSQDWWHREQMEFKKVFSGLQRVEKVLDVPVGTGRFFGIYREGNCSITGVDSSKDMLAEAEKAATSAGLDVDLRVGDARQLPFEEDSFDVVVCFRFLQSIVTLQDAKKVIAEISRVTRRYAVLELDFRTDSGARRFQPSEKGTMRNRFTQDEVNKMLLERGLTPIEVVGPLRESESSQYIFVCEIGD